MAIASQRLSAAPVGATAPIGEEHCRRSAVPVGATSVTPVGATSVTPVGATSVGATPAATAPPSSPTHRRRSRWFEANPGCFTSSTSLVLGTGAVAGIAAGLVGWGLLRMKRPLTLLGAGRAIARWAGFARP